jgi:hypothetical protein
MKALLLTILINVGLYYGVEISELALSVEFVIPVMLTQSSKREESK